MSHNEDVIIPVEPDNPDHVCENCENYIPLSEENWMDSQERFFYENGTNIKGFCFDGGESQIHKPDDSGQDCNAFKDNRK